MRSRHLFALVTVAMLGVSGCASGTATTNASVQAGDQTTTVHLPKSYRFSPEVIEIATSDTVTWINEDDFPHTVRLLDGSGVDKKLAVGERTSITFDEPGVFRYDCSLHPAQMTGKVIVEDGPS